MLNGPGAFTVSAGTDQLTVSGVVADGANGSQGLSLAGNGILRLKAANTMSGSVSVASGTLLLSNAAALQDAVFASGALSFDAGITSPVLGGLAGPGGFTLSTTSGQAVTLNVGNNNQSTTYSGALSGGGSLKKIGSGALTMSGASTFSGNTFVSSGTLVVGTPLALQDSTLDPSGSGTSSASAHRRRRRLDGLTNTGLLNLAQCQCAQSVALDAEYGGEPELRRPGHGGPAA